MNQDLPKVELGKLTTSIECEKIASEQRRVTFKRAERALFAPRGGDVLGGDGLGSEVERRVAFAVRRVEHRAPARRADVPEQRARDVGARRGVRGADGGERARGVLGGATFRGLAVTS